MHYLRTVLGREMVGFIIPILQLSKTQAVYLMIYRKTNDSPEIMQMANGEDFLTGNEAFFRVFLPCCLEVLFLLFCVFFSFLVAS